MVDNEQPPESHERGKSDMQLSEMVVSGLFGRYTHKIAFPTTPNDDSEPSVVILHGSNGVGKTTTLRMLNGLMKLDFDPFRRVPFEYCYLEFSTGQKLVVTSLDSALRVTFEEHDVLLNGEEKGALDPELQTEVEAFRTSFFHSIENISFNFLGDDRLRHQYGSEDVEVVNGRPYRVDPRTGQLRGPVANRDGKSIGLLSKQVANFIREAQLETGAFFGGAQPDLFSRILDDLSAPQHNAYSVDELEVLLASVDRSDKRQRSFGLQTDEWDFGRTTAVLGRLKDDADSHALTVLGTYADFLYTRSRQRDQIAERLRTFERVLGSFFLDKRIRVNARYGIRIESDLGRINEESLSSGEYQLLYLTVTALTTRRRGTVLAIDEPELSMHISWQRRLIPALIKCASGAAPQFVLATHSPDIAGEFTDRMIELSPGEPY